MNSDTTTLLTLILLYDAERKVRDTRTFDHLRTLQFDRPRAQMVEQPDAVPEQDGHQVDVYLVEQTRPDALLHDARRAHGDVLVGRDFSGLIDGALHAVRDERERRSFVDPFLRGLPVGDNERRHAEGRTSAPTVSDIEGPPPRYERPHLGVRLAEDL